MASLNTNITGLTTQQKIGARLLKLMIRIAECNPRYRDIQRYNAMSDADLACIGMTRADVVAKVFGPRLHY